MDKLVELEARLAAVEAERDEARSHLRDIARSGDTLSPQELINHAASWCRVDRHEYVGQMHPHKSLFDLVRERDEALGNVAMLADACSGWKASYDAALAEVERLREALAQYGGHERDCIRSRWEAGRPTPDGGYETCYAGQWYESRPVDRTPPCTCGFDAALAPQPEVKGEQP